MFILVLHHKLQTWSRLKLNAIPKATSWGKFKNIIYFRSVTSSVFSCGTLDLDFPLQDMKTQKYSAFFMFKIKQKTKLDKTFWKKIWMDPKLQHIY